MDAISKATSSDVSRQAPGAGATPKRKSHSRTILAIIGVFKLFKGALMLLVAVGALELTRKSVGNRLHDWANQLDVGPYRRIAGEWVSHVLGRLNVRNLVPLAVGATLYAGLFITEGVGLLMDKLWAEWLAVISTGGLIPLEILELYKKPSIVKVVTVVINAAIVVYLIFGVRKRMRDAKQQRHAG